MFKWVSKFKGNIPSFDQSVLKVVSRKWTKFGEKMCKKLDRVVTSRNEVGLNYLEWLPLEIRQT